MLYTVTTSEAGGATFTCQVEQPDERQALLHAIERLRPPTLSSVQIEPIGGEVRDLPVPAHNLLRVTPMNGLTNVWYFYGAVGDDMITGHIVATDPTACEA